MRECSPTQTCHIPCVTCHVTCHMSRVTCKMSKKKNIISYWQIGEAYRWRVCYQWGLPRLVSIILSLKTVVETFKILPINGRYIKSYRWFWQTKKLQVKNIFLFINTLWVKYFMVFSFFNPYRSRYIPLQCFMLSYKGIY